MKVSCLQEQLSRGLSVVSRAVSTKTTLPVLNNILIATEMGEEGGRLKLAATNLEISITVRVAAQVEEEGEVTVPARLLNDFVSNIPKDSNVLLTLDEQTLTLNVRGARFDANIKGIAAEDFPALPGVTNTINNVTIASSVLKDGINQVVFAASGDETRPVLTGVFASFQEDKVTFACADSFRLAVKTTALAEATSNNFSIILPGRAMQELSHILTDDDSVVEISITANKSQALFKSETVNFTSSLIEGNFPNYHQIIPKSYESRTVVATDQLLKAVKVASLFARDSGNNIVRVSIAPGEDTTPGSLTLMANAAEVGDNRGEVDATVDGQATQIAFNAKFMQDVLSVMETGQVALELQTSSNPGVFKPVGKDDYIYVIMPMYLANANR